MRRKWLTHLMMGFNAVLFTVACAVNQKPETPELSDPDTSAAVPVYGRHGIAHACAIGPHELLTSAHVVDHQPFNKSFPLFPVISSYGHLESYRSLDIEDLAFMRSETVLPHYAKLATEEPQPGERVWIVGYDWRTAKNASGKRIWKGRILRVVAGHLVTDFPADYGTSGSCVFNQAGEVLGVVRSLFKTGEIQESYTNTAAVGVWGGLLEPFRTKKIFKEEEE